MELAQVIDCGSSHCPLREEQGQGYVRRRDLRGVHPESAAHGLRRHSGFDAERFGRELVYRSGDGGPEEIVKEEPQKPSPIRMWTATKAFELGMSVEEVHYLTRSTAVFS